MDDAIRDLKKKFNAIRKMGYIKSGRKGSTGIGKTFEDLIEKKEDVLSLPDYRGIEIKTKRGYSKREITLFNAAVSGKDSYESRRIKDIYGYPDRQNPDFKVLNCSFVCNKVTLVANKYYFKLKIDYKKEKIYLTICDRFYNILESDAYWDFNTLKNKLYAKLNYLALIKAWPNKINGETYYKYYDLKIYKLISFEKFIKLIEEGKIRVSFKISTIRDGTRKGETCDHGTSFAIKEENLDELFDRIY